MGNANSGRRPLPAALKMLRGNPGQRKVNRQEPKPPIGLARMPQTLSSGAKLVWKQLASVCREMGTLTLADVSTFARLCELEATARAVSRQKDEPDFAVIGSAGVHAAIRLERETALALRSYYDYFGLTPSSRARLSVPKQAEAPVSKWAGIG